jgi:S-adenosylmethionine-dependent methyltransferase
MLQDTQARFDAGAEAWTRYNQGPLGRIRSEVTWQNLAPHLPEVATGRERPRVLDAGGGSGELALRLASQGYQTWLLDYAPAMLDQARQAAQAMPEDVQTRLAFCLRPVSEITHIFAPGFFDVVICHTLIEYLDAPRVALEGLALVLATGGLLSLSFVNRHAEVLRQVWRRGDPAGALAQLEGGEFCAGLFDVSGAAYTAGQVGDWLDELGLSMTANLGVRFFADFVPQARLDDPEFFDALLCLESAVAKRSPYHQLARYAHVLARKRC